MRKVFLLIGLSFIFFTAKGQTDESQSDFNLIQKTIQLYIDGQSVNDTIKVGQSFDDSWQIKFFRDNKVNVIPKKQYLTGWKKATKADNWFGRIVFIDITNNIAVSKVEISTPKLLFTDYFNLLKTDKGWLIVDKVSTRSEHKTVEKSATEPKK